MSDFDWDDDDNDNEYQDAGSNKALREARNAYKAQKKANKELLDQLEALKSAVRDRSVKDALKSKGLPEKISRLIPNDLTTSEEVEAWVDDYADVFGASVNAAGDQPADPAPGNPEFEALARISQTQAGGQPFSKDESQIAALIASAANPEELNKILFGNSMGPQAS